jgi:DNA (cytosine-5)-methyltransferase 1
MDVIKVGELFAGIGGLGLGLERAGGFEVKWQVERDKYALRVLEKHWPDVARHDDVLTFPPDNSDFWNVDLICGGWPCQDISVAGPREGLEGARSGLFFEVMRIAEELRPKYLVLENVSALLIRGMGRVLESLATLGYDAEWHCVPASYVGAPHRRDRVFILAHSDSIGRKGSAEEPVSNFPTLQGQFMRSRENFGDLWATEPDVGRVANGVSRRLDRIRCLGNSVVPQIAQVIGEVIKDTQWEK